MKKNNIQKMCIVSILAAIAAIVMILEIPIPFVPPFYKLDFSEVIVLLAGFSLGPLCAIGVEALKILLNLLINGTTTLGVGELANFIMGCSFVLPATILYHRRKTKKQALLGLSISIVSLCIVAALTNYFVLLPIYAYFFNMPLESLISMGSAINTNINDLFSFVALAVIPFNLLKGILSSLIILFAYKKIVPLIKK